jgi:AraC-like DNA-binding protein
MAEQYSPGTLDILGYVVLNCSTIGEVLDRTSRYIRVINDGMRVQVVRESKLTFVRCTFIESLDNYLLRRPREAMDAMWGGLARELGRLAHKPLAATEVWFAHAAPPKAELGEYTRVFGPRVKFGAPENRFIIPTSHLDEPIRSANPALLQVFEKHAEEVVAKLDVHRGPSQRVLAVVAARMKGAVPTLNEVARELAMSNRNLQRALSGDGTTYQKLVDELRRDLALSHLKNPSTSAGQVGFLLGFSEPSAFHRAFKRWTGRAPSEYRRALS